MLLARGSLHILLHLGHAWRRAWPAKVGNQCTSLTTLQQQGLGLRAHPCSAKLDVEGEGL